MSAAKNGKQQKATLTEKEAKLVAQLRERMPQLNETQAVNHLKDHNNSVQQTLDALLAHKGERWHVAAGKKDKPKPKDAVKPAPKEDRPPRDFKPRTERPPRTEKKVSPAPAEKKEEEKKEEKPAASISVSTSAWGGAKVSSGVSFADRVRADKVAEEKAAAEAAAKKKAEEEAAKKAAEKKAADKKKKEEEAAKKAEATPAKKPQHQIDTPPPRTAPASATVEMTPARFVDPTSPMGAGAAAPPPTPAVPPQSSSKPVRPLPASKPLGERPLIALPAHVKTTLSKTNAPVFSSTPPVQEPAAPIQATSAPLQQHHQQQSAPMMSAPLQQLGLQGMQNQGFPGTWNPNMRPGQPAGYRDPQSAGGMRAPANPQWNGGNQLYNTGNTWTGARNANPIIPQGIGATRMNAGFAQQTFHGKTDGGQW